MIKACVIGFPIKHSRSPMIHNHWLKDLGIVGSYEKHEVKPADLERFLRDLPHSQFVGCNVTLPHKEAACALVDHRDERATRTGSANTIYVRDGQTYATSTDGQGFVDNVMWRFPAFTFTGKTVMILGAGGSARAIIDELLRRGVSRILLANRTLSKAEAIANTFGPLVVPLELQQITKRLPEAELLVNTTSAGVADDASLDIEMPKLPKSALVTDINYVPLITPFLKQAQSAGLSTVPGLGMLLHQAVTGFEMWFGIRPKVTDDLYALVARDISPDYEP